jgi:CRP-like cAMP-binding protein
MPRMSRASSRNSLKHTLNLSLRVMRRPVKLRDLLIAIHDYFTRYFGSHPITGLELSHVVTF